MISPAERAAIRLMLPQFVSASQLCRAYGVDNAKNLGSTMCAGAIEHDYL